MAYRLIIVKNYKTCPNIMTGTCGFYCHENPDPITDPMNIPDTCELPIA